MSGFFTVIGPRTKAPAVTSNTIFMTAPVSIVKTEGRLIIFCFVECQLNLCTIVGDVLTVFITDHPSILGYSLFT